MWQIEVTTQNSKHLSDGGNAVNTTYVRANSTAEVMSHQRRVCTAISPPTWPLRLVLIFESRVGVRNNGRDVLYPIVVLSQSGGNVLVTRAGHRICLKVTYWVSADGRELDNLGQGLCSVCHDPLESGKLRQCPQCGRNYHPECLGDLSDILNCPACEGQTLWYPGERSIITRRCLELSQAPGPTIILVGCGNIGSKLALELPLLGIRRVVLVDPDRICVERNGRCCTLFASAAVQGRFKVDVIKDEIRKHDLRCEAIRQPKLLRQLGLSELRQFTPAILVGAVDSRRARLELVEIAAELDVPLVDLAISGSPKQVVARIRTTWSSVDGISAPEMWSAADWQLLDEQVSCGAGDDDSNRPVSSVISGALAAVLGLKQITKLLAADSSDIGWETRIDLDTLSLVRSRLKSSGLQTEQSPAERQRSLNALSKKENAERSATFRRNRRFGNDIASLTALAQARPNFSFTQLAPNVLLFRYADTPGLIRTTNQVQIWSGWQAAVLLPPQYPFKPPLVMLRPAGKQGLPFHPNVRPGPPHIVCYGQYIPVLLLDELARRLERIINLEPRAVMTDEADSLNRRACRYVRQLAREHKIPLTAKNTYLPGKPQPEQAVEQRPSL